MPNYKRFLSLTAAICSLSFVSNAFASPFGPCTAENMAGMTPAVRSCCEGLLADEKNADDSFRSATRGTSYPDGTYVPGLLDVPVDQRDDYWRQCMEEAQGWADADYEAANDKYNKCLDEAREKDKVLEPEPVPQPEPAPDVELCIDLNEVAQIGYTCYRLFRCGTRIAEVAAAPETCGTSILINELFWMGVDSALTVLTSP